MTTTASRGMLLLTPHQFPDLNRESALAEEFGLQLVVAENQADLVQHLPSAKVVMVTPYGRIGAAEVALLKGAEAIVRYGVGYDNIDTESAGRVGVPVTIVPDASTEEVAGHAFALGIALNRRIPQGQDAIRRGAWAGAVPFDGAQLRDLEVGVIGMGRIGRLVADLWRAVGARVRAYDPFAHLGEIPPASIGEILRDCQIVTLHVPLLPETRHMIRRETLATMRPDAVVVNVSRGGLIDEADLADALRTGRIAGAGIDVFEVEPLPETNPLRTAPNVILTPHSAWKSRASLGALQSGAVQRARLALSGQPLPDVVS